MNNAILADFSVPHKHLIGIEALRHPPLKGGPAVILQNPRSPVIFNPVPPSPYACTAAEVAKAKAEQEAEREANGLCIYCGRPRAMHMDSSGCILMGCQEQF